MSTDTVFCVGRQDDDAIHSCGVCRSWKSMVSKLHVAAFYYSLFHPINASRLLLDHSRSFSPHVCIYISCPRPRAPPPPPPHEGS